MGIQNKQIGWSQESNLLWQIAKQLEQLQGITASFGGGGAVPGVFTTTVNGLVPAPGSVSGRVLSDNGTWILTAGAVSDATTLVKGIVQLAGDLSGTAAAPTVPGLATKAPINNPTFTGTVTIPAAIYSSATANTIAIFDATKTLISAATATYPNLTELSYVKGVTAPIQPQFDNPNFTDAAVTGAYNIDWSKKVQRLTLTGATTWTNINVPIAGNTTVMELIVSGAFALTLPADWTAMPSNNPYSTTVKNHIVASYTNFGAGAIILYSLENMAT